MPAYFGDEIVKVWNLKSTCKSSVCALESSRRRENFVLQALSFRKINQMLPQIRRHIKVLSFVDLTMSVFWRGSLVLTLSRSLYERG